MLASTFYSRFEHLTNRVGYAIVSGRRYTFQLDGVVDSTDDWGVCHGGKYTTRSRWAARRPGAGRHGLVETPAPHTPR